MRSLPAIVTVCVAALTLVGALASSKQAQHNAQARRTTLSADIRTQAVDTVNAAIQRTVELAVSIGADWPANTPIFAAVARKLEREPGINGVGLVEAVGSAQRARFERRHGPIETGASVNALAAAPPIRGSFVMLDSARSGGSRAMSGWTSARSRRA